MAGVLPHLQKLRVINFGDCLVRSEGARAIAEAIKEGHQLLEVKYSSPRVLRFRCIPKFTTALYQFPHLDSMSTILDLHTIVGQLNLHVGRYYINFGSLHPQEVNLSYCELDRDAGLAVAESLANKKALKTIELNGKYYASYSSCDVIRLVM